MKVTEKRSINLTIEMEEGAVGEGKLQIQIRKHYQDGAWKPCELFIRESVIADAYHGVEAMEFAKMMYIASRIAERLDVNPSLDNVAESVFRAENMED